jgi:hypothetical protein
MMGVLPSNKRKRYIWHEQSYGFNI